jgi:hypothetical protein
MLNIIPSCLADALQHALDLTPNSEGQRVAQHEMTIALEPALDARRQRILNQPISNGTRQMAMPLCTGDLCPVRHRYRAQRQPACRYYCADPFCDRQRHVCTADPLLRPAL